MKTENNPYFKNHYKPSPLWKVVSKLLALPFLFLYASVLKLCIFLILCTRWFVSLFTNRPISIDGYSAWYWVRGKQKSMYKIIKEENERTGTTK
jgi:hypothetical protein